MPLDVLYTSLAEMRLTDHLNDAVKKANFNTLNEIIMFDVDTLIKQKGFTLHAIVELITLLEKHGLEKLLKE